MATASAMGNGATENEESRLLGLPQELLDPIFSYAYPPPPGEVKLISRKKWDERERKAKLNDSSHNARPFPPPKVADFLISKKFLANAASAYVGNQRIDAMLFWDTWDCDGHKQNVLPGNATHILTGSPDSPLLRWVPKLRKITLEVSDHDLREEDCYYDLLESSRVSDSLLKDTELFRECATLALSDIVVKSVQFSLNQLQNENFEANMRRIEELLKPIIKKNWKNQEAANQSAEEIKKANTNGLDLSLPKTRVEGIVKQRCDKKRPRGKAISDEEIPDDPQAIRKLMMEDPDAMVAWIQEAKELKKAKKPWYWAWFP